MPTTFYNIISRVDHFLSAFMPKIPPTLNLSESIDVDIKLPQDENQETQLTLNQNTLSIPFNCNMKSGSLERSFVDYSLTSICSLYKDNLNTLSSNDMILTENIRKSNSLNDDMLLFAECSEIPRLAVFMEYKNGSNDFSQIKVNAGNHFVTINADRHPIIFHDNKEYNLTETVFEYPSLEKYIR